jgi:hypothetical protein
MARKPAREKVDPMSITRPIKIKRDLEGAKSVVKRLRSAPRRDTRAEQRLEALLAEMDRYDASMEDSDDSSDADASLYGGPRRRWSDDGPDD